MSEAYAQYTFLPWVRQGLSRYLDTPDQGQTDADAQAALPVRLRLNQYDPIERTLDLLGPGDVVGLEAAQVIRREPERQSKSFAANMSRNRMTSRSMAIPSISLWATCKIVPPGVS